jgi:alkylation response protein AidB-like acyl-CoA dehydrogenase
MPAAKKEPTTDELAAPVTSADLWARSGTLLPAIAEGAARREADRVMPAHEVRTLANAGLLTWRVPTDHGGPGASVHEVMRFIIDLATADANIAQAMRPGFGFVEGLFEADEEWRRQWYERLPRGEMFGGAFGEVGAANGVVRAQLTPEGDHYRANGRKFYSTGALFSDWITITASNPDGEVRSFTVPSDRDGLRLVDDWDAMGQRLTASGSTYLDDMVVYAEELRDWHRDESERSLVIPFQQLFLAAVEAGIARNAVADAVAYAKARARPIKHSVASRSVDDPYVQHPVGEMAARAYAAEAGVLRAAGVIDEAHAAGGDHQWQVRAAIEVAQAQFIAVESALRAAELLFDVGGGSAALRSHNLDRHWRNARTVANHNPRYYKAGVVGRFLLTGEDPPNSSFF